MSQGVQPPPRPRAPVAAWIGVGANLGDALGTVRQTPTQLARLAQTQVLAVSPLYRSAPLHAVGPDFINAVVAVRTGLSAPALLGELLALETRAGRTRPHRNAARTLDLDLLLYGQGRIASPWLTLPHPRMLQRAFVLRPLADIAPHLVPPEALAAVAGQALQRLDATAP